MDNMQIKNITQNLMYKLETDESLRRYVKGLVKNHWPRRGQIYGYLCNTLKGSIIVYENKHYYIVHWDIEQCRTLMNKISKTTLVQRRRTFENAVNGRTIIEAKVFK